MPGANYMGGKRNAAMARSRDATGRAQKGYFGRQRMEALTRGLQAEHNDFPNGELHLRSCSIDLAHAQRDAPLDDASYPDPSPTTPQSNPSNNRLPSSSGSKAHGSSSSRSSIRSSKVLLAMDTTEPIAMRAERNRLLAIPDFAGLSKREHIRTDTPLRLRPALKRRKSPTPDSSPQPKKPIQRYSSDSGSNDLAENSNISRVPHSNPTQLRSPFTFAASTIAISKGPTDILDHLQETSTFCEEDPSARKEDRLAHKNAKTDRSPYVDSGYAESLHTATHIEGPELSENDMDDVAASSFERDSSMLCLDTSPPTSSAPFQAIIEMSQRSSSSFESYLPDFSAVNPQPLDPNAQPMTPSTFRRNMIESKYAMQETREALPSSMAEPPPPTFCMPSPPKSHLVTYEASPDDALSDQPSLPSLPSSPPQLKPRAQGETSFLDEENPWEAIGKYLDLKLPHRDLEKISSPPHHAFTVAGSQLHNRSGVGYNLHEAPMITDEKQGTPNISRSGSMVEEHLQISSPLSQPDFLSSPLHSTPAHHLELTRARVDIDTMHVLQPMLVDDSVPATSPPCLPSFAPDLSVETIRSNTNTQRAEFLGPCLFPDSDDDEEE